MQIQLMQMNVLCKGVLCCYIVSFEAGVGVAIAGILVGY